MPETRSLQAGEASQESLAFASEDDAEILLNGVVEKRINQIKQESCAQNSLPSPACGRGVWERVLLSHAKRMRSNQTDAEQKLWYFLRARRFMGLPFKRQKPIGPYIADFVCMKLKLIIEADGGQHGNKRDAARDAWLQTQGFFVLHFWNHDVLTQTESVLEHIRQTVLALQAIPSPPAPLPQAGEGSREKSPHANKSGTKILLNCAEDKRTNQARQEQCVQNSLPSPACGRGVGGEGAFKPCAHTEHTSVNLNKHNTFEARTLLSQTNREER